MFIVTYAQYDPLSTELYHCVSGVFNTREAAVTHCQEGAKQASSYYEEGVATLEESEDEWVITATDGFTMSYKVSDNI